MKLPAELGRSRTRDSTEVSYVERQDTTQLRDRKREWPITGSVSASLPSLCGQEVGQSEASEFPDALHVTATSLADTRAAPRVL